MSAARHTWTRGGVRYEVEVAPGWTALRREGVLMHLNRPDLRGRQPIETEMVSDLLAKLVDLAERLREAEERAKPGPCLICHSEQHYEPACPVCGPSERP